MDYTVAIDRRGEANKGNEKEKEQKEEKKRKAEKPWKDFFPFKDFSNKCGISAFMEASNTKSIPAAFLLEHNKIIHHSHPMEPRFSDALQAAAARAIPPPKALPLITDSREDLMKKSNKELRQILKERGISDKDCLEKSEFVDKIISTCSKIQYYETW